MRRVRGALIGGAAVLLAVVGCGSGSKTQTNAPVATAPAAPKPEAHVDVHETEFKLSPAQLNGGDVGLVRIKVFNDGKIAHSLAVDGPNGVVYLDGQVDPGKTGTLEVDLDKPGTYTMFCPLDGHRAKGMVGSVTVGGSTPASAAEPTGTTTTTTQTTPTQTVTQTQTQTRTLTTPTQTSRTSTIRTSTSGTSTSSSGGY